MRTFDLTPLYRNTVASTACSRSSIRHRVDAAPGYPPYNIERTGRE